MIVGLVKIENIYFNQKQNKELRPMAYRPFNLAIKAILIIFLVSEIGALDIYEPVLTSIDSYNYGDISEDSRIAALTVLQLSGSQYIKVFSLKSQPNQTSQLIQIKFPTYPTNLLKSIKLDSTGSTMAVSDAAHNKLYTFQMKSGNFSTTADQLISLTQIPISLDLSQNGNRICVAGQRLNAVIYASNSIPKNFILSQTLNLIAQTGNTNLKNFHAVNDCQFTRDSTILMVSVDDKYLFDYRLNSGSGIYQFRTQIPTNIAAGQTIKIFRLIQNILAVGTTLRMMFFRMNSISSNFQKFQQISSCDSIAVQLNVQQEFALYECKGSNTTNIYLKNSTNNNYEGNMTLKNKGNTMRLSVSEKGNFLMILTDYFIGNFTLLYAYPCFPGYYQQNATQICKLCSLKFTADCLLCEQNQCTCKRSLGYSANRRICTCTDNSLCGPGSGSNSSSNSSTNGTSKNNQTDIGVQQLNQSTTNLAIPIASSCAGLLVIGLIVLAIYCLKNKIPFLRALFMKKEEAKDDAKVQGQAVKNLQNKQKFEHFSSTRGSSNCNQSIGNGFLKFPFKTKSQEQNDLKASSSFPAQDKQITEKTNFRLKEQKNTQSKEPVRLLFFARGSPKVKNSTLDKFFNKNDKLKTKAQDNQSKQNKELSQIIEYPQVSGERLHNQIQD